jgi:Lar family restriction alleviation protein
MKTTETASSCNCTGGKCSCDRDRITPPQTNNDNCPFCGSTHTGMEGSLRGASYAIMCYVCGAKGPIARKQEIAVKKWNRDV